MEKEKQIFSISPFRGAKKDENLDMSTFSVLNAQGV